MSALPGPSWTARTFYRCIVLITGQKALFLITLLQTFRNLAVRNEQAIGFRSGCRNLKPFTCQYELNLQRQVLHNSSMFTTTIKEVQQTINNKTNRNAVNATLLSFVLIFCTREDFSVKDCPSNNPSPEVATLRYNNTNARVATKNYECYRDANKVIKQSQIYF